LPFADDLMVASGKKLPLLSQTGNISPLSGHKFAGHKQQGG
jgi:hypothetical protein